MEQRTALLPSQISPAERKRQTRPRFRSHVHRAILAECKKHLYSEKRVAELILEGR